MAKQKQAKKEGFAQPDRLFIINKKLDLILENQQRLMKEEKKIEREEIKELAEEKNVEGLQQSEVLKLDELEKLEEALKQQVEQHPLTKITYRDLARGSLGAFIGIILHYTIIKGVELASTIDMTRAALLYPLSFFVGTLFLYSTGFRKVKKGRVLIFLPIRITVLYIVSLILSVGMLYLLYPAFGQTFSDAFKQTATVSLPAVVGACTADLIGKD